MMLRSANLESRQSWDDTNNNSTADAPLREFGIKAKHPRNVGLSHRRCSAPRIWNQGKASGERRSRSSRMLRSANLESRQSKRRATEPEFKDAPLREFGIKAKHVARTDARKQGCSAPRIWNQGKAGELGVHRLPGMLRSANLESRQSTGLGRAGEPGDAPLREFGIKAKRRTKAAFLMSGCSAPRIWNQGKARAADDSMTFRCSAPRIWNQGKAEYSTDGGAS